MEKSSSSRAIYQTPIRDAAISEDSLHTGESHKYSNKSLLYQTTNLLILLLPLTVKWFVYPAGSASGAFKSQSLPRDRVR